MSRHAVFFALLLVACGGEAEPTPNAENPPPVEAPPAPVPDPAEPAVPEAPPEDAVMPEPVAEQAAEVAPVTPTAVEPTPTPGAVDEGWDTPPLVPAFLAAESLDAGPWVGEMPEAAAAGLALLYEGDPQWLGSVVYQRRIFALFAAPIATTSSGRPAGQERFALWFARVATRMHVSGRPEYRREAARRLYEGWFPEDSETGCTVEPELRARDLDGDGEVEITAMAAMGAMARNGFHGPISCSVLAFIVGGDDLNVQARFTREHVVEDYPAGREIELHDAVAWRVGELNADGHADLHVVQRWRFRDDSVAEDDFPPSRDHASDHREVDCLWDAATDTWPCPTADGYALGSRLFPAPGEVIDPIRRYHLPPWMEGQAPAAVEAAPAVPPT